MWVPSTNASVYRQVSRRQQSTFNRSYDSAKPSWNHTMVMFL